MESINYGSNKKRLCLNGDENKIIEFNPQNLETRKKFLKASEKIFESQRKLDIELKEMEDEQDNKKKIEKSFELEQQVFNIMKDIIDDIFGVGTTDMITDNYVDTVAVTNFIIAIAPYFKEVTENRKNKYINGLKDAGLI